MTSLVPLMDKIDWWSIIGQMVYWIGIILLAGIIIFIMIALFYLLQFRIKVTEYPMYGSGKDGIFSIGKPKKNRIKWINNKSGWKSLYPLFNKNEIQPFDSEYIYPGNHVYTFVLNDKWIPGRVNINKNKDDNLSAEINPVPYDLTNWHNLMIQKHEVEYAKQGFWEENKYLFITLGVTAFNLILCGTVIWLTYKYAQGGRSDAQMFTNAIKQFSNIGSGGMVPK